MQGRTCLVTGANRGIGFAIAHGLAAHGAHVILVVREAKGGNAAAAESRTVPENDAVGVLVAVLASQASIREVAEQVLTRYRRLHVLVNNAGVITRRRSLTVDGIETQFAVNHLAYFLLT